MSRRHYHNTSRGPGIRQAKGESAFTKKSEPGGRSSFEQEPSDRVRCTSRSAQIDPEPPNRRPTPLRRGGQRWHAEDMAILAGKVPITWQSLHSPVEQRGGRRALGSVDVYDANGAHCCGSFCWRYGSIRCCRSARSVWLSAREGRCCRCGSERRRRSKNGASVSIFISGAARVNHSMVDGVSIGQHLRRRGERGWRRDLVAIAWGADLGFLLARRKQDMAVCRARLRIMSKGASSEHAVISLLQRPPHFTRKEKVDYLAACERYTAIERGIVAGRRAVSPTTLRAPLGQKELVTSRLSASLHS